MEIKLEDVFIEKRNSWETVVDALEKQMIEAKHQVFRYNLASLLLKCREYVVIYEDSNFMPDKATIYKEHNQFITDDSKIWEDPLVAINHAVKLLGGFEKVKDYNYR